MRFHSRLLPSSSSFSFALALAATMVGCGDETGVASGGTGTDSATGSSGGSAGSTGSTGAGSGSGSAGTASGSGSTSSGSSGSSGGSTSTGSSGSSGASGSTGSGTGSSTGGMAVCGDGMVGGGEACDDGNLNSDIIPDACRTDCSLAGCGDSVVDSGEQCDDGNTGSSDGCDDVCFVEVTGSCGDGALTPATGEECDDGNMANNDGCSSNCQFETLGQTCGDGSMGALEVCDDANTANGDGCNPTCNLANDVTVWVGDGTQAFLDGQGTSAQIGGWGALAADNTYLWYADSNNRRVRRITISNAQVLTVAGDGMMGNIDADGLAARFGGLEAITTDGTTLWVADSSNARLKEIIAAPPYTVTTVAGNGTHAVTDGTGTAAEFDDLRGVTYYGGYVWLLDANGAVLRRFDPSTQQVTTVAGANGMTGQMDGFGAAARFISPRYMASDNSGNLFISDTNGYRIRTYNTVTTWVGTFAGGNMAGYQDGIGASALIHRPRGMTSDGTSIYFSEFNQHTVRQGIIASQSVTTLAGMHCGGAMNCTGGYVNATGTAAQFNQPFGIAYHYPSKSLFVLDAGNFRIRRIQ